MQIGPSKTNQAWLINRPLLTLVRGPQMDEYRTAGMSQEWLKQWSSVQCPTVGRSSSYCWLSPYRRLRLLKKATPGWHRKLKNASGPAAWFVSVQIQAPSPSPILPLLPRFPAASPTDPGTEPRNLLAWKGRSLELSTWRTHLKKKIIY